MHLPVLLHESIQGLAPHSGSIIVDGTLGFGGHSKEILPHLLPGGLLIGIDRDSDNLQAAKENLSGFSQNTLLLHSSFSHIKSLLEEHSIPKIHGILLDLGIASSHVDRPERGFSFLSPGPLDMRMDTSSGICAADIIHTYSEREMATILWEYGEEPFARFIAKKIVERRKQKRFTTTVELAEFIESIIVRKVRAYHPALLTFQALRIAVNGELDELKTVLQYVLPFLECGARVVVISYHSLEDRIVKRFFRDRARHCLCPREFPICQCYYQAELKLISSKAITPTDDEKRTNPRSRSAKLRIAERTSAPLYSNPSFMFSV